MGWLNYRHSPITSKEENFNTTATFFVYSLILATYLVISFLDPNFDPTKFNIWFGFLLIGFFSVVMLINIWTIPVAIFVSIRDKFRRCSKNSKVTDEKEAKEANSDLQNAEDTEQKDKDTSKNMDSKLKNERKVNLDEEWEIEQEDQGKSRISQLQG